MAQIIGVRVGLDQPGPVFYVDGTPYQNTNEFFWPVGSKHILEYPDSVDNNGLDLGYQLSYDGQTQWTFAGWKDNLGLLLPNTNKAQTITVFPGLSSIIGSFASAVQFTIVFPEGTGSSGTNGICGPAPAAPTPGSQGWGIIDASVNPCIDDTYSTFVAAGSTVTLNAFPYPGYAWVGFEQGGNPPNPFLYQVTVNQATILYPIFTPAKRVSFRTDPPGLQVVVDSATITVPTAPPAQGEMYINANSECYSNIATLPPKGTTYQGAVLCQGDFDFVPSSKHIIGAPPTQQKPGGGWWVFTGFTNGLGQNSTYVADSSTNQPDLVTAQFAPGVQSQIQTNPPTLKLVVDGVTVPKPYTFVWAQGSSHTVSAPATQVDASGRTWQFSGWSNGGEMAQTITAPASDGYVLVANYTELGQVQVTSVPPGLSFTVGGSPCTTPCAVSGAAGTTVQITAPATIPQSATSRLDFGSWAGAQSGASITATYTQGVQSFTAQYHTSYLLLMQSNPANAISFQTVPPSPDGFFPAGTTVSITPVPATGYKFSGWAGDATGTLTPAYLTLNVPHNLIAFGTSVPSIAPAGIMSAAGPTPDGTVAPGSMISIYGQNLAGEFQIGPTNPLAQTLGNVTVTVNDFLLPLLFVSPTQINAQVPVELADGTYTLTVLWQGQAPVTGTFKVKRHSPGIYTMPNDQHVPLGAALHQDGTLITMDSPARRNEIVSFYGTGIGPRTQPVIDGFPAPLSPLDPLADPVMVNAGGVSVPATWAGAAPTLVGTDIVQLKIVDSIPSNTTINVTVSTSDTTSAIVQLPVE